MRTLLFISFIIFSLASRAETTNDTFVKFQISSLQLFSSFSSFIYFQGSERNIKRLLEARDNSNLIIAQLPDKEVELKAKWKEINDYIEANKDHQFDGADMSLEAAWSIHQREFNKIINKHTAGNIKIIDGIQIKMEAILSQYMGYANSTTGGYGVSFADVPLDKLIANLSKELDALEQADAKYQELNKLWNYIQKTLLAYNSNVVPFVVIHTYERMRKEIANLDQ